MGVSDPKRGPRGRFLPGSPGRKPGAVNKNRGFLNAVKALAPEALEKLKVNLMNGERWAIEFVLNHALPKDRTVELEGATAEDIAESLVNGEISPSEARDIVFTMSKVAEYAEIEQIQTIDAIITKDDTVEDAQNKYMRMLEQ